MRGVERVIALADELGGSFKVRGIRLDSGDIEGLASAARKLLDAAGLEQVQIFASGNLDEHGVQRLVRSGAPINAFGIGTRLGTSEDAPNLDIVYKLAQLDDQPLLKLSTDKGTLPGVKQVWRDEDDDGFVVGDSVGLAVEDLPGRPLLVPVMEGGRRLPSGEESLDVARDRAAHELRRLPAAMRRLDTGVEPYSVKVSKQLQLLRDELASQA
jgi:nicotinate phosphoribosyltransferase